jgi:hypothetical protein
VTPARRGKANKAKVVVEGHDQTIIEKIFVQVQGKDGNDPKARDRMPVGVMPGVAANGARARANGWIVSAKWGKISGRWQGAGPFVTCRYAKFTRWGAVG